jgi:hypothetical protein
MTDNQTLIQSLLDQLHTKISKVDELTAMLESRQLGHGQHRQVELGEGPSTAPIPKRSQLQDFFAGTSQPAAAMGNKTQQQEDIRRHGSNLDQYTVPQPWQTKADGDGLYGFHPKANVGGQPTSGGSKRKAEFQIQRGDMEESGLETYKMVGCPSLRMMKGQIAEFKTPGFLTATLSGLQQERYTNFLLFEEISKENINSQGEREKTMD